MANLHINFRSDCISRSVYPVVFLPDFNNWRDVPPPYPTLYFLPGYSGGGLETAMFSRYVGQELVEVTRSVLPLSRRREDTFIGGISMGGYGALINGLRFADTFSKIAMLSPALGFKRQDDEPTPGSPSPKGELLATLGTWKEYQGSYRDYSWAAAEAAKSPEAMPDMILACGKSDGLITPAKEFAAQMESLHTPLAWYEAEGGHDHTFWKQALTPMFRFLTGKEDA